MSLESILKRIGLTLGGSLVLVSTSSCADITPADVLQVGAATWVATDPKLTYEGRVGLGAISNLAGASAAHQRAKESAAKVNIYTYNPRVSESVIEIKKPEEPSVDWDHVLFDSRVSQVARHGNKVAFTLNYRDNSDIYVANSNGTNLERITFTPNIDEDIPVWIDDGERIMFRVSQTEKRSSWFKVDKDGSNPEGLEFLGGNDNNALGRNKDGIYEIWSVKNNKPFNKVLEYRLPFNLEKDYDENKIGSFGEDHCVVDDYAVSIFYNVDKTNGGVLKVFTQNLNKKEDRHYNKNNQTFFPADDILKVTAEPKVIKTNGNSLEFELNVMRQYDKSAVGYYTNLVKKDPFIHMFIVPHAVILAIGWDTLTGKKYKFTQQTKRKLIYDATQDKLSVGETIIGKEEG